MGRFLFKLEFDGREFCGWQMQSEQAELRDGPAIQTTLERAVSTVLRMRNTRFPIQGCGRTDAGVHARVFYAHADLPDQGVPQTAEELERFRHSLNGLLPEGIAVLGVGPVAPDFHVLDDLVSKIYEYRILVRRTKPTLDRERLHWLPLDPERREAFDVEALEAALKCFEGEHDFVAFASVHGTAKTTVRRILNVELRRLPVEGGLRLDLRFEGEGFLKQQVRTLVGTAVEVAEAKRSLDSVRELLRKPGKRVEAGYCAPAAALFLTELRYGRKIVPF